MKCERCGKPAVIEIGYASKVYCSRHFINFYEKKVMRIISKNKMFNKKNNIVVAVSGGKDSMALLFILKKLGYNIKALFIDEGIKKRGNKAIDSVKKLCKKMNVPLEIFTFKKEYKYSLDEIMKKRKTKACTICGVLRRNLLNKAARRMKADILAVGHNLDDEAQVILMNFFRSELERIGRSGAIAGFMNEKSFVKRAKPLRECSEKENVIYVNLNKIRYDDKRCPYGTDALRGSVRECLDVLEEKHPSVKIGILHSFDKISPILRKHFIEKITDKRPNKCSKCGEVTNKKICRTCEMIESL